MELIIQKEPKKKRLLFKIKGVANSFIRRENVQELSEQDRLKMELDEALEEMSKAEENFDNASADFIDVATHKLNASSARVDLIIKELKKIGNY